MNVDHIGIATTDADGLVGLYTDLFDTECVHSEEFREMEVRFLAVGSTYLEILEPRGDGAIANYLSEHGPGIHHLAVETDDVDASLEQARSCGVELVDKTGRPGAWGHTVAFLHPGSTGGVLIEFVEHDE